MYGHYGYSIKISPCAWATIVINNRSLPWAMAFTTWQVLSTRHPVSQRLLLYRHNLSHLDTAPYGGLILLMHSTNVHACTYHTALLRGWELMLLATTDSFSRFLALGTLHKTTTAASSTRITTSNRQHTPTPT